MQAQGLLVSAVKIQQDSATSLGICKWGETVSMGTMRTFQETEATFHIWKTDT